MEPIIGARNAYYKKEEKGTRVVYSVDDSSTKIVSKRLFSDMPVPNDRSFSQKIPEPSFKRQKIKEEINQESNQNDTISTHSSKIASPTVNKINSLPVNNRVLSMDESMTVDQIKRECAMAFFSTGYYKDVLKKELEGLLEIASQIDSSEAQTVLNGLYGVTWWIRKGFLGNQELYKGIVYLNGTCILYLLFTDQDLLTFFNTNASLMPYLEVLRKEKISNTHNAHIVFQLSNGCYQSVFETKSLSLSVDDSIRADKIKKECAVMFSSIEYYVNVFRKEAEGSLEAASQIDSLEAQAILGDLCGTTWWIRKGFLGNQELYKGIMYLNGKCTLYLLFTDQDLLTFFDTNIPLMPHLEELRKEKISNIKNEHIVSHTSGGYYQAVFEMERTGLATEAHKMDLSEGKAVLGGTLGITWWIRKSFLENQELYTGILYLSGQCSFYILRTDSELLYFFNKSLRIPDLETLRREKINKIKNEYLLQPFYSGYYEDVFKAESEERLDKAIQLAISEAKSVLNDARVKTWWIQRGFYHNQETYRGVIYWNEQCTYHALPTDNDLIDFYNKNASILDLEGHRRRKIQDIKDKYIGSHFSGGYYQVVFEAERNGLLADVCKMDLSEGKAVLGSNIGTTWWIRKSFVGNQELYTGIVYLNGKCALRILRTDSDLLDFFNKNHPLQYLETIREKTMRK